MQGGHSLQAGHTCQSRKCRDGQGCTGMSFLWQLGTRSPANTWTRDIFAKVSCSDCLFAEPNIRYSQIGASCRRTPGEGIPTVESGIQMNKLFALLFASILFVSPCGCEKKVDKADVPVEDLDLEGIPPLGDEAPEEPGETESDQ